MTKRPGSENNFLMQFGEGSSETDRQTDRGLDIPYLEHVVDPGVRYACLSTVIDRLVSSFSYPATEAETVVQVSSSCWYPSVASGLIHRHPSSVHHTAALLRPFFENIS